ncbi:DNA polymerase III subunit alpha [Roseospirillum parvum]|uniref:DNA polymerase III subunit alpha n=1 Tax=Roseospirillum parvum TaxID=83401 RepID=A0A1G7Y1M2_9PROT|nr:DNA polymerase III subunit alpha [Roseospirillum parvum]SDG90284.1 DNA polymerase-3 subunit alpha [Roseospirillum parvum]
MTDGFVHLRVHTAYSLSEGAIPVKALPDLCAKAGMPAVGLTDTRNLFGALEASTALSKAGIQPIVGCQMALARPAPAEPSREPLRPAEPEYVVLLAQTPTGYRNLLSLVSTSFLDSPPGALASIAMDTLAARAEGLIVLSGGIDGPVARRLLEGRPDEARQMLQTLATAFPGRTYVEIQRHGLADQDRVEPALIELAYALDLPLVATNDCHFPDPTLHEAADALLCMSQKATINTAERRRLTPEHWFKPPQAMRELFADLPEAVDNTLVIARRCAVMAEVKKPILPTYTKLGERSVEEALGEMARAGLERRLWRHVYREGMTDQDRAQAAKPYRERLEHELTIIGGMGFPGYFLIVADFIQWAKDHDIPVGPGRGSGAGSVVAWALTITDLDPIRFTLLFERFLNPERVSMPDFDIDFCQHRREEVIRYVQKEYGTDRVAQIITFGKLQARAVVRSVGRVLEMPLGYVDRICKMIPNNPANPVTLKQAVDGEPQLQELRDGDPDVARLLGIGMQLEGLYSHASTHAAGVVIGDRPLDELVPLYRDPNAETPVTQFNMKWVEQAGLVKFDFLGLKTLTVLKTAVDLLAEQEIEIDLSALPLDDRKTFDMLSRGETAGVFQLESAGMRDVLKGMKPDTLEDIIAVVALYRPGPMDNIPSYIRRKHGEEPVHYLHPSLETVLKETYGIMIYQEQVMQAAQVMAGYSLGNADLLRRAMGKKIQAEMDKQRQTFVEGATARGIPSSQASQVFDTIAKFAGYGFNKSHAAAYALVAYQTGYMKANHPVAFMAATMTFDKHNTDKLGAFKGELKRLGIPLLPPDVNVSGVDFRPEKMADGSDGPWAIRYALSAVRNVGTAAMEALVAEREANGPFADLTDFAQRMDARQVNRRLLESLIKAGALDSLNANRAQTFEAIESILRHAQSAAEERASNQVNLFGGGDEAPRMVLPKVVDWNRQEKPEKECEAIGFFLSAHPLDEFGERLERLDVIPFGDLKSRFAKGRTGGGAVRLAGIVTAVRIQRSKKNNNRYAFVTLSDTSGIYEVTLFSEVLASAGELISVGRRVLLSAAAEPRPDDPDDLRLTVQAVRALDEAMAKAATKIRVRLETPEAIEPLKVALGPVRQGGGARVVLVPSSPRFDMELTLEGTYSPPPGALDTLRVTPGVLEVAEF